MSLANKSFISKSGEIITILDTFDDIAISTDKRKFSVNDLTNGGNWSDLSMNSIKESINVPSSMLSSIKPTDDKVDPDTFFNTKIDYNNLVDKLKTIPTDQIPDNITQQISVSVSDDMKPITNESAIIQTTKEDMERELLDKYKIYPLSQANKQAEMFDSLLNPIQTEKKVIKKEDPVYSMFKGVKRSVDFKIEFNINDKLPRLDFIEMMEESYEVSIIDYLTDSIVNKILNDPNILKEKVKEKIKESVYGKKPRVKKTPEIIEEPTPVKTRSPRKKPNV